MPLRARSPMIVLIDNNNQKVVNPYTKKTVNPHEEQFTNTSMLVQLFLTVSER